MIDIVLGRLNGIFLGCSCGSADAELLCRGRVAVVKLLAAGTDELQIVCSNKDTILKAKSV